MEWSPEEKHQKKYPETKATGRTARAEMTDNGMRKNGPSKRTAQARGGEAPVDLTGKEPVTKTDDRSRPNRTIRPPKRFGEWVPSLRANLKSRKIPDNDIQFTLQSQLVQ